MAEKTLALRREVEERKFVQAYVAGGRGVAGKAGPAALSAGLGATINSANVKASYLLRRPTVLEAIRRRLEAIDASDARITEELGRVAFSSVRELDLVRRKLQRGGSLDGVPDHVAAMIQEIEVSGKRTRVKAWDKIAALGLLAKIRRMLAIRLEHTGKDGGPIEGRVTFYLPAKEPRVRVVDGEQVSLTSGSGGPSEVEASEEEGEHDRRNV